LPAVVRTYAPAGQTPVRQVFQTRDHLSVMTGITPAGHLFTLTRSDSLTAVQGVHFIKHVRAKLGTELLAVWDGSPIHRGPVVRSLLASGGAPSVSLEQLPGYAPDLNPDEGVWAMLKYDEMRNLCCRDSDHLRHELHLAIIRVRRTPRRIQDCIEAAGLPL
jgi:transposase